MNDLKYKSIHNRADWDDFVDEMSDDQVQLFASLAPWASGSGTNAVDEDGFVVNPISNEDYRGFDELQKICWNKFNDNPHINSHVRDFMGNLTGYGFDMSSFLPEVQKVIKFVSEDVRNEFTLNIPKYVARSEIEGELFLACTIHTDGFVEIDFMEPSSLKGNGDANSGIYFHPKKKTMPILYNFEVLDDNGVAKSTLVPSIYAAHYPEFITETLNKNKLAKDLTKESFGLDKKYRKLGGYRSFIIEWNRGFLTKRNASHIKTTLEWINHYVNLKKWEIDHKKSSGSYLWVVTMEDTKAFRTWLKMTEEEKQQTGLTTKKTPGGTIICPPGVKIECKNPQLASISEQDTDIMHMVTAGLNKPEDMVTGQTKGDTFSGVKASRGPQADRIQDDIAYFERFLRYTFWRSIFFLHNAMVPSFKLEYKIKQVVGYKAKKAVLKPIETPVHDLVFFDFPTSEIADVESKARAFLGVSHASIVETLGIPRELIAKKMGFGNYAKLRFKYDTEEEDYPELPLSIDLMAAQSASNGLAGDTNGEEGNGDTKSEKGADVKKTPTKAPEKKSTKKMVRRGGFK